MNADQLYSWLLKCHPQVLKKDCEIIRGIYNIRCFIILGRERHYDFTFTYIEGGIRGIAFTSLSEDQWKEYGISPASLIVILEIVKEIVIF